MATRQVPAKPPQGKQPPVPANQTLYIANLPASKIRKDDLKTALYMLFSTYGPVLDVNCMKTKQMRGQAHIVFRDIQAATQAMRSLEGFSFLGQNLRIQYAKGKSDIISKLDGSFEIPGKEGATENVQLTETQQSIFNAPAPGTAASTAPTAVRGLPAKPPAATTPSAPAPEAEASGRGQKRGRDEEEEEDEEEEDSDVAMEEDSDED